MRKEATSKGSGEPALKRSIARALTVRGLVVGALRKLQAKHLKTHIPLCNILMTLLVKYADNRSYICGDLWLSNR